MFSMLSMWRMIQMIRIIWIIGRGTIIINNICLVIIKKHILNAIIYMYYCLVYQKIIKKFILRWLKHVIFIIFLTNFLYIIFLLLNYCFVSSTCFSSIFNSFFKLMEFTDLLLKLSIFKLDLLIFIEFWLKKGKKC